VLSQLSFLGLANDKSLVVALLIIGWLSPTAYATVVRYDTTLGVVDVRLFDTATPLSAANFLNYANANRWDNTFIHRSVPGFVVQGGGFSLTPDIFNFTRVTKDPPVTNEPGLSNLRGTVAYAKVGPPDGQPPTPETINSATSEWFFNLSDNSGNLNFQNGGFTVFGRVVNGMDVVDAIAALQTISTPTFTGVPVLDFDKVVAQQNVFTSDAVIVNDISALTIAAGDYDFDGNVDSADLSIWNGSFGSITELAADGSGDAIVNGIDFLAWQRTIGGTSALSAIIVPEPSTIALAGLAFLAILGRLSVNRS